MRRRAVSYSAPYLGAYEIIEARRMWRSGLDTRDIAIALSVTEAAVWNTMAQIRGRQ